MRMIDLSPTQTTLYNEVDVDSLLKTNGSIIVGSWSGPTTWTDNCKLEPTGNATFTGVVNAGTITSNTMTTSTLTTAGAALNIKSDIVLFQG